MLSPSLVAALGLMMALVTLGVEDIPWLNRNLLACPMDWKGACCPSTYHGHRRGDVQLTSS
jgi:hypothetical protein